MPSIFEMTVEEMKLELFAIEVTRDRDNILQEIRREILLDLISMSYDRDEPITWRATK